MNGGSGARNADYECFFSGGDWDQMYGCYAPQSAALSDVVASIIWSVEGMKPTDLTDEEHDKLVAGLMFIPLRSVVKADWDQIGDDCEWHTEASGRRSRACWWIETKPLNEVLNAALKRAPIDGYGSPR